MQHSKLTARIPAVAEMFDVSISTIRRRMRDDPEFPKPFRMAPNGDLQWSVAELQAYVAAKASRARTA